jgi:hypothetical protein
MSINSPTTGQPRSLTPQQRRARRSIEHFIADAEVLIAPRADAHVIFRASRGDEATVIGRFEGFTVLDIDGIAAYVPSATLTRAQDEAAPVAGSPALEAPPPFPLQAPMPSSFARRASAPAFRAASGDSEHTGANRVATGLTIFAWIVLIGGNLLALGMASSYDCGSGFGSTCSNEGGSQLAIFAMISVISIVWALFIWAAAYGVLLLASINNKLGAQERG